MSEHSVQVIERDGKPEYAVLAWQDYLELVEQAGQRGRIVRHGAVAEEKPVSQGKSITELAALRESQHMDQASLARSAGISPSYLAMIESGEREASPAILRSLALALGVSAWI